MMYEEKKINEIHTNLMKHLMKLVKKRGIEELAVLTEEIIRKQKLRYVSYKPVLEYLIKEN